MTLLLPPQRKQPAPFQVVDGNTLELVLSGRPFQPEQGFATMYRTRERLRGSKSNIDFAREHFMAIRHHHGQHKLGIYRYDETGQKPAELLAAFRLERVR